MLKRIKRSEEEIPEDPIKRKIQEIEDELARTQYNKATQKHVGTQKAKLAQLRQQLEAQRIKKRGKKGLGFGIRKTGDATVLFIGPPSVGKSTLLNSITNADSEVGAYAFTTLKVIPGVLMYRGAHIQILDIPGLITGAAEGKGHGKEILSMARAADLICLVLDASQDYKKQMENIKVELYEAGFRLNQTPPEVKIQKHTTGGLSITNPKKKSLPNDVVKEILNEFGVYNAEVVIVKEITIDQLVDSLAGNMAYIPFIVVINKSDTLKHTPKDTDDTLYISAKNEVNLDKLVELIWTKLHFTRIYMKKIGKEPDMKEPLILKDRPTVADVSKTIHKEFHKHLSHARIWGPSAKFPGQRVGPEQKLQDEDIVELHLS